MSGRTPLIGILLVALAAFGFNHFVLAPKREVARGLEARIAEQQTTLDGARQLLALNAQQRNRFRGAYAKVIGLGKAVPADDDTRSLVFQLNAAAAGAGVRFGSITVSSDSSGAAATDGSTLPPGTTAGSAGFARQPFTLSFSGTYADLNGLLRRLRAFVRPGDAQVRVSGRLIVIDSIKLTPSKDGFPRLDAEVGATTFLVPAEEGLTDGTSATGATATPSAGATAGTASPAAAGTAALG